MPSSGCQKSALDRKSTRLNSSHGSISYAVFCLKKETVKTSQHFSQVLNLKPFRPNGLNPFKYIYLVIKGLGTISDSLIDNVNFFFNDTATTEIYTLSLHDALPIWLAAIAGAVAVIASSGLWLALRARRLDRKSTRLNSSHRSNSYAAFCLNKQTVICSQTNSSSLLPSLHQLHAPSRV